MAYEDTKCPCGDKKPTDTMLCDACNTHLASRREMAEYQDPSLRVDYRRSAAIILVSLARRRKRECANVKLCRPADIKAGAHGKESNET